MAASSPLPIDVFLSIFRHLTVQDILKVRKTCKNFLAMTKLRSVWHLMLQVHVQEKNIPIPGLAQRSIGSLTADELERYTLRALRLRRNWASPEPAPTRHFTITPTPEPQSRTVALHFLPGRQHRWLLSITLTLGEVHNKYTIQCWDVEASPPALFARRVVTDLKSFAVNTDTSSPGDLALQFPHTEIFRINFAATDPGSAFISMAVFRTRVGRLHAFTGSTLLTGEGDGRLSIWSIDSPEDGVNLQNPENPQPEECQGAFLHEEFAIVLRITTLEIYGLSPFRNSGAPSARLPLLHPSAQHKWPWRLDSICITPQATWSAAQSKKLPPIDILIRFGSWFPWPINILHHFVLQPSDFYTPSSVVNENNLPYLIPPISMQSIASPVRLFATSHMALGTFGTALWIDSHTEDYFGHGDRGQRLAGSVLTSPDLGHDDGEGMDPSGQVTSSIMASAVYGIREEDVWVRVALDEEEGRIAVGCVTGEITLFQYI